MRDYKMPDIYVKENIEDYLILLDAGHGGIINGEYVTPGKRAYHDGIPYYEGVGNRIIRDKIAEILKDWNINYEYVDNTENDISLVERVKRINNIARKYKNKRVLLVSIHSDAFSDPSAHGWSVYTSVGDTGLADKAATLAYLRIIDQFPEEKMRIDMSDGDPDKESQFYILKYTNCPAVLTENFFMTNPKECKEILMTEEGQNKIAIAHALFINDYIKKYL